MDTEPCPHCDGRRTTQPPQHPADVAHWDPDGQPGMCPAEELWTSTDPAHWHHPRAQAWRSPLGCHLSSGA